MKISNCDLTTSNNAVWDYLRRPSFPVATCAWQAIACKGRGTDLSGELFYSQASVSLAICEQAIGSSAIVFNGQPAGEVLQAFPSRWNCSEVRRRRGLGRHRMKFATQVTPSLPDLASYAEFDTIARAFISRGECRYTGRAYRLLPP